VNLTKVYENIKNEIKLTLDNKRFEHSLNVELEAIKLAEIYGSDVEKARVAAIAHDVAKDHSDEELLRMAQSYSIKIDEIQYNFPQLLHGPVAALICSTQYGIRDQDVLNAIKYHTTGRKSMSLLEKIIYLSDVIEPGRNFPGISDIREIALMDIDRALILACNSTLIYITKENYLIHPLTIEFRNSLLLKGGILNERKK
jgi:predicted HD superfamily hydrolase involved in NAD metabolism